MICNLNNGHIRLGSPTIDMGTDVNILVDIACKERLSGSAPDIGAYEYGL